MKMQYNLYKGLDLPQVKWSGKNVMITSSQMEWQKCDDNMNIYKKRTIQ